jgi:two-component system chemotaxis response regulator CheY
MQPSKVLVIDDSKLIHKMFTLLLPKTTLVYALDGQEALERLVEHPEVDVIFLDINMPRMNGIEFLHQVKADPVLAQIPVIIISTEGREVDTIRGLKAGAAAYVKKPFRNETILEIMKRVMGRSTKVLSAEWLAP